MRKASFCISGVADRNPLFCAECCFGMHFFTLLHCTIVHYLAPVLSKEDGGGGGGDELPCVDHVPLNEGDVGIFLHVTYSTKIHDNRCSDVADDLQVLAIHFATQLPQERERWINNKGLKIPNNIYS